MKAARRPGPLVLIGGAEDRTGEYRGLLEFVRLAVPDRPAAHRPEAVAALETATGVFFTGGNQLRITNLLGGSPVDLLLHRRRGDELVLAGTSAGTAMMSGTMIRGGANEATRTGRRAASRSSPSPAPTAKRPSPG